MTKRQGKYMLFLLLPLLFSCVVGQEDDVQEDAVVQVGDRLPAFDVVMSDGQHVTTDSLLGRRSVVVFFHTTCSDCRKELPQVDQLYRAHRQEADFRLVCIAREEQDADIRDFWEKNDLVLPYSPQPDSKVYNLFARRIIPRIYIASPDGIVRFMHDDQKMPTAWQLEEELGEL